MGPSLIRTTPSGTSQIYPNGITSGPLTAFSAHGAGMANPYNSTGQGLFTTGGSDPSVTCPLGSDSTNDNFWIDVQVSNTMPSGYTGSLRLWPNFAMPTTSPNGDNTIAMSGTAFALSESCTLSKIWMHNPPGSNGFPSRVGIWNSATQTEVSGTDNASPTWLNSSGSTASAGAGWVYVDYSSAGVTLPAGSYVVSYFNGGGHLMYYDSHNYWFAGTDPKGGATVGGAGYNGISWGGGILTAPNVAGGPEVSYDDSSGTFPGQSIYKPGTTTWSYPSEFEATSDWGENRWADVEVIIGGGGGGTPVVNGGFLKFFP